jgi:class 3 adenylate cyclase/predicted ATPase
MDVGGWLRSLGLGQYEAAFRANEIDSKVLPDLTAEDLKELGVSAIGHRRAILAAIAKLSASPAAPAEVAKPPFAPSAAQDTAERRQLTVMFCDLVGSTALSARLDPEDMREIIGAYHRCCAEQITRAGGFVAKYMGDGMLAYFGYPQAHEDDAERAVRAGLALVEAIPTLRPGHDSALQVRIGVATGLVVVGDLIGEGAAQEQGVVGETPNVAARLQTLAEPGHIAISDGTRRLTGGIFEYHDLGMVQLKGLAVPMRVWRVTGASAVQSRFEATHETVLTPLVGREEERELLMRRWRQAVSGEGRVVLLSGEPGVGKSRLTVELQARLQREPHTRLRYFCSPHHIDSALHPTIAQLEGAAGFERDDTPETKLDKVTSLPGASSGHESDAQLLAELLSIPTGGRYAPLDWSPQRKKERTFAALLRQLEMLSRQRPLLVVYEDVHWIDASSRELLDMIVDRVASLPVLLIIAFRPEFQPPWIGQAHVSTLNLSRLGRREGAALVGQMAGSRQLPNDTVAEIVERTDGVPLFIEELTKAVLEGAGGGDAVEAAPLLALNVPATLHASLMARVDRLGPVAKELTQIGAAIGREFSYELLATIADRSATEVRDALDRLGDASLVFRRGVPPSAVFLFKHALVQDVAYGTLLRGQRRRLHGRIAKCVEDHFPEIVANQPEVLARHCSGAGFDGKAVTYWRSAGAQAVRRAANLEAIEHFRRALTFLASLADTVERMRTELAILAQLGPALMSVHGWPSREAGEAFERAGEVARRLESSVDLAPPLVGLWLFYLTRGQLDRAEGISSELFRIARELDDPEILLQAYHASWPTRWLRGLFPAASEHIAAGMRLYDEKRHEHHRYPYMGHDPAVCALSLEAPVRWLLGHPAQAARVEDAAVELAQRLRHAPTLAHGLWFVGEAQVLRGDVAAVAATATKLLELCEEHKLPHVRATGLMFRGWALARSGEVAEGASRLQEGLSLWERLGGAVYRPRGLCLLAEVQLMAKRYADGLETLARALAAVEQTGERWSAARVHQIRAELLLHAHGRGDEGIEASLRTAIEIAQAQSARGWELKSTTLLARLRHEQGKRSEARDLLAPVYGWFTEGFDTPDLKEAKALLGELR